ncbi:beta-1,6-N-acetylglucosaminyltransferase [Providencia sp. M-8]|uniref:beta-1,6-N-acetylglucosaminyltransferase n=1 Tax=Providencia sp. M-8 TaxID=2713151 RepID=UPI00140E1AF3
MKTAVLIQSHNNSNYICNLARIFYDIRFYVHIDKKNSIDYDTILESNIENITLIKDRINVFWGGASQIYATLNLLKEAIKNPKNEYFHLMSGECLPLKDFKLMEQEWSKNPDINYIESHLDKKNEWRLKVRVPHADTKYLRTFLGKVFNKILKFSTYIYKSTNFNENYFYFGSQWFSINRNLAEKFIDKKNDSYFRNFENITCADEHAFQILARMESEPANISDNNKRFIIFKKKSSPEYLTEETLLNIDRNNYWFARKVKEKTLISQIKKLRKNNE